MLYVTFAAPDLNGRDKSTDRAVPIGAGVSRAQGRRPTPRFRSAERLPRHRVPAFRASRPAGGPRCCRSETAVADPRRVAVCGARKARPGIPASASERQSSVHLVSSSPNHSPAPRIIQLDVPSPSKHRAASPASCFRRAACCRDPVTSRSTSAAGSPASSPSICPDSIEAPIEGWKELPDWARE